MRTGGIAGCRCVDEVEPETPRPVRAVSACADRCVAGRIIIIASRPHLHLVSGNRASSAVHFLSNRG